MLPATMPQPWAIYAGDPTSITLTVTEGDPATPRDLSGENWECQWRTSPSASEAVAVTVDTTDAAAGTLTLSLTGAQTAAMRGGGVWDVQGSTSGTIVRGTTTWTQDVTRDD